MKLIDKISGCVLLALYAFNVVIWTLVPPRALAPVWSMLFLMQLWQVVRLFRSER